MNFIDLRSDTVTWPTDQMREAMKNAAVGDDGYGDDPTTIELESYAASLTGKEAAIFVPSGTFGNQLALFTHCRRGQEVVLDDSSHIVQHEAGASSIIAGVQLRTVSAQGPVLDHEEYASRIRVNKDIHEPETGLICLENAHSLGSILPLSFMEQMKYVSSRYHVPIHLDGARLFNACLSLHVQAVDITKYADSVMVCLSKGLCVPAGSFLAGTASFIHKARANRKIMGGGMRQTGFLAAAGLVALKEMRTKLSKDHDNADYLANELSQFEQIEVDFSRRDINMVFFAFKNVSIDPEGLADYFKTNGILINKCDTKGVFRFVTHHWIERVHIDSVIEVMGKFLQ